VFEPRSARRPFECTHVFFGRWRWKVLADHLVLVLGAFVDCTWWTLECRGCCFSRFQDQPRKDGCVEISSCSKEIERWSVFVYASIQKAA